MSKLRESQFWSESSGEAAMPRWSLTLSLTHTGRASLLLVSPTRVFASLSDGQLWIAMHIKMHRSEGVRSVQSVERRRDSEFCIDAVSGVEGFNLLSELFAKPNPVFPIGLHALSLPTFLFRNRPTFVLPEPTARNSQVFRRMCDISENERLCDWLRSSRRW